MLLLSLFLLVAFAVVVVLVLTTRDAVEVFVRELGIGEPSVTVWMIGRWPVLLAVLTLIIAVLYFATPNIRRDERH